MAHFAKIKNDKVVQVIVVNNEVLLDENNVEQPQKGIDFLKNLFKNENDEWIQTSFSNSFRKVFASVGYTYDRVRDVFIPFKLCNSWVFNENSWKWEPPIPYPKTFNNFPKDREGNYLNNIILDKDYKIIKTLSEDEKLSDNYIWNEEVLNWQTYPEDLWTEEKQQLFLIANNL